MKRSALLFTTGILTIAALGIGGCAADSTEDTATAEGEIINFPAAVFTNAPSISYGQTLTNLPFKAANRYAAVKFNARTGDRITGTVSAQGKRSIVYVARKSGTKYVNVNAGGADSTVTNVVLYTVEQPGEYFLVYRTMPTADAQFNVSLARAGGQQACADAGATPSVQDLVSAVDDGAFPMFRRDYNVWIERRACTYATGCVVESKESYPLSTFQYRVVKAGGAYKVETKVIAGEGTLSPGGLLSGSVYVGTPRGLSSPVFVPVSGTLGPTCLSLEETFTKIPKDEAHYTEFRVAGPVYTQSPLPAKTHPAAAALPSFPELDTIADEDVLSRFPRGASTMQLDQALIPWNQATSAGVERNCHPLTSCSAVRPVTDGDQANSACMRFAIPLRGEAVKVMSAKVVGRDGYALETSLGTIAIQDGVGTIAGATLRLGTDSAQITFPPRTVALGDDVQREASNTTCTLRFRWPTAP